MSTTANRYRDHLAFAGNLLLILLFVYAAGSKLLEFDRFQHQLLHQGIPRWLAALLAYALPALELGAVTLLLFPRTYFAGLLLAFLLLALFSGYIGLVLLGFWDRTPCSCGGILNHLSWQSHLFFNLTFLAIAFFCLYQDIRQAPFRAAP